MTSYSYVNHYNRIHGWNNRPHPFNWRSCSSQLHMREFSGKFVTNITIEKRTQTNGRRHSWSGCCEWCHGSQAASPRLANQISRFFYIEINDCGPLIRVNKTNLQCMDVHTGMNFPTLSSCTWNKIWKWLCFRKWPLNQNYPTKFNDLGIVLFRRCFIQWSRKHTTHLDCTEILPFRVFWGTPSRECVLYQNQDTLNRLIPKCYQMWKLLGCLI